MAATVFAHNLAGLTMLMVPAAALACPKCASADAVREALASDPNTWKYAAIAMAPFVIFGLIGRALHGMSALNVPQEESP